jgi:hypothetical protein
MERRKFLASSLAASALAVTAPGSALEAAQATMPAKGREFYQLRRYHFNAGPQRKLCDDYFRDALIPALNRLSISPVGVLDLSIGPDTRRFTCSCRALLPRSWPRLRIFWPRMMST